MVRVFANKHNTAIAMSMSVVLSVQYHNPKLKQNTNRKLAVLCIYILIVMYAPVTVSARLRMYSGVTYF